MLICSFIPFKLIGHLLFPIVCAIAGDIRISVCRSSNLIRKMLRYYGNPEGQLKGKREGAGVQMTTVK